MFYTVFNSASSIHINWLRKRIYELLGIKGHISQDGKKSEYQLKYAKNESKKLVRKIFYSNKIPFLKRKYLKIKQAGVEE